MLTSLAQALWHARGAAAAARDLDPVFASRTGGILDPGNLHARILKPAAKAAGLDWIGFQTLRHTCAAELFCRGVNAKQASDLARVEAARLAWFPLEDAS